MIPNEVYAALDYLLQNCRNMPGYDPYAAKLRNELEICRVDNEPTLPKTKDNDLYNRNRSPYESCLCYGRGCNSCEPQGRG